MRGKPDRTDEPGHVLMVAMEDNLGAVITPASSNVGPISVGLPL